jgi:hypothetical protein
VWYRFEDTTGPVCDSSGNGNHGTASPGGVTRGAPGKFGWGISFDGSGGHVTVPAAPSLDMLTGGTIEYWLRLHVVPPIQSYFAMIGRGTGNSDNNVYNITTCGDLITFFSYAQTQTNANTPCNALSGQTWTHVAVMNDGANLLEYVNGVVVASFAGGKLGALTSPLTIGQMEQGIWSLDGDLDDVKWWTVARTAAQICTDAGGAVMGTGCSLPP